MQALPQRQQLGPMPLPQHERRPMMMRIARTILARFDGLPPGPLASVRLGLGPRYRLIEQIGKLLIAHDYVGLPVPRAPAFVNPKS
jgi:hypothetical protein